MSAAPSPKRRTDLEGLRRTLRSLGVPFAEWTSEGQQLLQYRTPDDQPRPGVVFIWVHDEDGMSPRSERP